MNSPTKVVFAGTTGKLKLDQSQTFTGTIGALTSTAPGDAVDLKDIDYAGATKTYVGTTQRVLSIKDGVHAANLSMIGDYTVNSFNLQNDGSGRVQFYDPSTGSLIVRGQRGAFVAVAMGGAKLESHTSHRTSR